MQRIADRGHQAEPMARQAAITAMTRVKAPGHTVLGSSTRVRVSGPRAGFVARAMAAKASVAARKALRGVLR